MGHPGRNEVGELINIEGTIFDGGCSPLMMARGRATSSGLWDAWDGFPAPTTQEWYCQRETIIAC